MWLAAAPPPPTPPTDCDLYLPSPAPLFRADVALQRKPQGITLRAARAYIIGLGYFTLTVNGVALPEAGDLDPALTSFNKTLLYSVQNATAAIGSATTFTLGVALGNGWWNPLPLRFWGSRNWRDALATGVPTFRLTLYLTFSDGSQQVVVSTPSANSSSAGAWVVGPSEVLRNNIYLGTVVNRSAAPPAAWALPGWSAGWPAAVAAAAPPLGRLTAAAVPPVRRFPPRPAVRLSTSPTGTSIYDVGVNMAGVCQWCLPPPSPAHPTAGLRLALRYGEILYPNGSLNGLTSVAGQIKRPGEGGPCAPDIAWQADEYYVRGDAGGECYTPPFTWHAFRYIEVSGAAVAAPQQPLASLRCYPMRSDLPRTSAFASSSPTLNAIHAMEVATQEANLMSIQSDCPHRERLGYGGDALMSYESLAYNFDWAGFAEKRAHDFVDAQRSDGGLTETAPNVGISDGGMSPQGGPIGWQAYLPIALAWGLRYHGNALPVAELYGAVGDFIALLRGTSAGRIEGGLGDWMDLEPSPLGLTGWGFAFQCHAAFAALAGEVGDGAGQAAGLRDAAAAAARITQQYLDPSTPGLYRCAPPACTSAHFNNSQCGQALALHLGLVPQGQGGAALALLADNLAQHAGHLQVGGFGIKWLLIALGDGGRPDLSYALMTKTDYPSYGYMLTQNATTIWESWSYSDSTFSHNHPMFAGPTTYMFQSLAGLRVGAGARGADLLDLRPQPPPAAAGLQWVNASWVTVRGEVSSHWQWQSPTTLFLRLVLPPNMQATLTLPLSATQHSIGSGAWEFTDSSA